MRKNLKKREFQIWILISSLAIMLWISFLFIIFDSRNDNEITFLNKELERLEGEFNSSLNTYKIFSNYIFNEINRDEEIKTIMYRANFASDQEKDILRKQLYDKLYNQYLNMRAYNYRQFHFHLPNTESFLRLHRPDKYGDILEDVRESVRLANEKIIPVSGFEEGKIFNGFRHVYPLVHNDMHIGSVEISISSCSIIEVLSKDYTEEDFYFIIDKSAVDGKAFDSEINNYRNSSAFTDYYIDAEVDEVTDVYNKIISDSGELFFQDFNEKYSEKLKSKESFSLIHKFNDENYIVKFLSIENLEKDPIAYLISISKSIGYERFSMNMYLEIILITLLIFSTIIFSLIFSVYNSKLKKSSQRDPLTNLYNRNKFYEITDKEIKSSRRYKYNSSIMLMDIDYFKNINDTYGHPWGDKVLKKLSNTILENIRETDVFARWGGEEFILLLPHTKKEDALKVAEKLRKLIEDSTAPELKEVTISIGVAEIDPEKYDIDSAIKLADEAMYCAKKNGRNQVYPMYIPN